MSTVPQLAIELGAMVGEYRIEGVLGEGGMGTVYAAVHPVIAKRAAVKILRPELSVNREAVERFAQEARAVNQIGHPNIVDIFAFGALPDGRCYFVMEWLRGESLASRIARERLSIGETLAILDTIAVALAAAHEAGIVHRDLKPDNVFLCDVKGAAPTVKLLDFGIAKLLGTDELRLERTRTGNLLGTPAYMSPEQARGYAVDHRTDLYAFGAMAFELLTGSIVFDADNVADMIAHHLTVPPRSARALNPAVPASLDALVTALLAKEAAERPSLDEVRAVLRAAALYATAPGTAAIAVPQSEEVAAVPPPRAKGRAWLVALVALVVAGAGIGAVAMMHAGRDANGEAAPAAAPVAAPPAPVAAPVPAPAPIEPAVAAPAPAPLPPVEAAPAEKPAAKPLPKKPPPKRPTRPASHNDDDAPM